MHSRTHALLAALVLACACSLGWADEVLVTRSGIMLPCKVLRLSDDGRVVFKAPVLDAEARGIRAELSAIHCGAPGKPDTSKDAVFLTNGDRVVGDIVEIGVDKLVLKSMTLGQVDIPRGAVSVLMFNAGNVLHEIDFRYSTSINPWIAPGKTLRVVDGALVCGRDTQLSLAMAQKRALTVEVMFVRRKTDSSFRVPTLEVALFAANRAIKNSNNRVYVNLGGSQLSFNSYRRGRLTRHVRSVGFEWLSAAEVGPKSMRIAYDPSVPELICWIEGRLVRRQKLTGRLPKKGKYITLNTVSSSISLIQSIRVLSGVMPPVGYITDAAAAATDTIVMSDGKRHTGQSLMLTAQGFQMQTPGGNVLIERDKVARILLASDSRERPRRVKGDVRVHAAGHILTMQLNELTSKTLAGTSVVLGTVKLDRAGLRIVKLNIYAPDKPVRPAQPTTAQEPFAISFKSGLTLPCRVVGITTDGKMRFRTPLIDGVASAVPGQIKRLKRTTGPVKDSSALALILTNGDRVAGDLVEVADEDIVMDCPATGEVSVKRTLVRCIGAASEKAGCLWSEFSTDVMAPWRSKPGMDARIWDGALRSTIRSKRSQCIVAAPLKQDGPLTLQVEVGRGSAPYPTVTLWLYASGWRDGSYANGIRADFNLGGCIVFRQLEGSGWHIGTTQRLPLVKGMMKVVYTVSYDPVADEVKVWVGTKFLGMFRPYAALPPGREVAINLKPRTHILSANVRPGVHTLLKKKVVPDDHGRVVFENGDSVSVKPGLSVEDGRLIMMTANGEMRCPFENVARIDLPVARSTLPKRHKDDVRVQIGRAVLTMQIIEMTETTLRGRSDYLGEVNLPRKMLHGIKF